MKIRRPMFSGLGHKRPIPLSLVLTLFCCLIGVVAACFNNAVSFSLALGDTLMIASFVMFGLAWVGYLKKDGIRFFHPRKSVHAGAAESWKDRVPGIGEAPPPLQAIPGAAGPEAADYRRLAEAEEKLRKKILGIGNEAKGREDGAKDSSFIRSAALSGLILLILALGFEYIIPRLPH